MQREFLRACSVALLEQQLDAPDVLRPVEDQPDRLLAGTGSAPPVLAGGEQSCLNRVLRVLEGMPEYPHYTRPASYRGWEVPEVLVSGDHERVREWRVAQSRARAEQFERGPE